MQSTKSLITKSLIAKNLAKFGLLMLAFVSAVQASTMSVVRIEDKNVVINTERGEVSVPRNPKKVVVFDWAALDTLTKLNVPVGGTTAKMQVDYLADVFAKTPAVGTLFDPNYEAVSAYAPDLIITGGPGAQAYPELLKLAPTIDLTIDNMNIIESGKQQMDVLGAIFDKQAEVSKLKTEIEQKFAQLKTLVPTNQKGLVLSITGTKINALSPNNRVSSWIHKDLAFPPADTSLESATHGQAVSFEYLHKTNPDWIFVLDRTSSLGQAGPSALSVLDNELVHQTTAWQKKQIVVLPNANYIVAGGAQQLVNAAQQLIDAFSQKK